MGAHRSLERTGVALALLGAALSVNAVWPATVAGFGQSYWDDRSTAVYLLVVSVACAVLAPSRATRAWTVAGSLLLLGFHVFVPLAYAPDRLGELGMGAWLGLAGGALVAGGAGLALRAREPARGRASPVGSALTVAGAALTYAAVWSEVLDVDPRTGLQATYWDFYVTGHELGIFMLVVTSLAIVFVALARPLARLLALALALLLLGFVVVIPISSDVHHLGELGPGAWLGLTGGLLLVAGVASFSRVRGLPSM